MRKRGRRNSWTYGLYARHQPICRRHYHAVLTESQAVTVSVGVASVEEIDDLNILKATHLSMQRAVEGLARAPDHLLVDGRPVPGFPVSSTPIIRGDAQSLSIAAASVMAKVTRDELMDTLHAEYPHYGFTRNKGYGTPEHLSALQQHGPSPCHRRSFAPVRQLRLL